MVIKFITDQYTPQDSLKLIGKNTQCSAEELEIRSL